MREARLANGMTMKQIADKLHISESYYCSIENGYRQRDMDISLANGISKVLKISVKQILQYEQSQRVSAN